MTQPASASPIPLVTFLHKVFPSGTYPENGEALARDRVFRPRRSSPLMKLDAPIDWEQADSDDRNFRMQLQGWTMLHPVMNVFDELHDKASAIEYFFDIARDWWDSYANDPEDIVTSRTPDSYAWYDMSVGFRALIIAFFLDRRAFYNLDVAPEDRELIQRVAQKHANHLRHPEVFYPNNHGIFQMHGLRALSEVCDYKLSQDDKGYANKRIQELFELQFDPNGIHREHSPHYHIYAIRMFESVVASGWYNELKSMQDRLGRAHSAVKWLVDPLRRPATVGDSIPTVQKSVRFPAPDATDQRLILSPFNSSGYAIARSPWGTDPRESTYLFFMASYHSKSHKHRDCLSFEWFDSGDKRISDSGKYGYWRNDSRRYVLSSRAHNSVEIERFDILRMSPYGSAITAVELLERDIAHISGTLAFKALAHTRRLFLRSRRWVVVDDHLSFEKERDATQWFHLGLGHELVSHIPSRAHFKGGDGSDLIIAALDGAGDSRLHLGDDKNSQGYVSEGDDHIEPGFAIGRRKRGLHLRFMTVLALGEDALEDGRAFASEKIADRAIETST